MKNTLHTDPFEHEKYERDSEWMRLALDILWWMLACGVIYLLMTIAFG